MQVSLTIISYIVAALWFYGILKWDVHTDFEKWKRGIPVNHTKEAVIRGVYLLPSHILLFWPKIQSITGVWDFILYVVLVSGILFTIWWEFFDGWYNKIRGFKWRFNGSVDKDDPILDKFLYSIGDTWEAILKWSLIATFIFAYIKIK